MTDYEKLLQVPRATKDRLETVAELLKNYTLIYSIDTNELGVKLSDGTITYFGAVEELEWANILNKPTFATVATSGSYNDLEDTPDLDLKLDKNFSALPTQANPLLTDVLVLNRGTTVQKVTLGNLLAQVDNEIFEVVSVLPATGVANKIYLVPSGEPETQNELDEYIWVDNAWEKIGAVTVDLSDYFNKTEINSLLDDKVDKNTNITAGTHPKITYDAKGLVTGGEELDADDIPDLAPSKITQNATNRFVTDVEKAYWDGKQDKLVAGTNITINPITNVISASGGGGGKDFHRVRIFNENGNLIQTQVVYDGEKISRIELESNKFLFEYGTENSFSYATKIYEDIDLVLGDMPARYVQTTVEDFDESGNYTGSESYIILPSDKPDGYKIVNPDVIGVATNGDYLTSCQNMFRDNPSLYLELDYLDTSNVIDMSRMFQDSQATTLDLSSFDTSKVTIMSHMFLRSQATTLDLSSFDTSNVTDMSYMFQNSQATTLDLSSFDTSNVTDMSYMFNGSQVTTLDLSNFNTSNVTTMRTMFQNSQATTLDLSSFDTSNVTDMSYMFNYSQVTTLDLSNFNTSNVTTMRTMFQDSQATTLDLSSFDTSNVTDMSFMFFNSKATTLDLSSFDTSNVTDMARMFYNSQATTGYARTQADANRFNSSSYKPSTLTFVVK